MGSRRSRLQISIEILKAISSGEQKLTRLMYACNLSWNSIRDILGLLVAKGYVDELYENEKRKRYTITSTGRDVVRYYAGLHDLIQVSV
jgi:predicted transcriptional regulator